MAQRESDLYPLFSRYISKHWGARGSAAFELKIVKTGNPYQFAQLEAHQERSLQMCASATGVYHKISDQSLGQKPFDSFLLANCQAYVVICFNTRAYFVDIDKYLQIRLNHARKSIHEHELVSKGITPVQL
jgi:hypothetical protein